MKLRKVGKFYHAELLTQPGTRRTVTTRCTDKREARQVIRDSGLGQVELAAKTHRLTGEGVARILAGKRVTIERAVHDWGEWLQTIGRSPRTIHNALADVRRWARAMKVEKMPPASITEKHIGKWVNDPKATASLRYRRVLLWELSSFFGFCAAKGWTVGDPSKLVRINMNVLSHEQKESKPIQCFTDAEIKKLIQHTGEFWQFAVAISRETGLRLTDVAQLEWACFESDGEVHVWTDKGNTRVAIPITESVQRLLTEIPVMSNQYLFPDQRAIATDPVRRAHLSTQFKRICDRLGIEGKTFHSVRHTLATELHNQGQSLEDIQRVLGHRHAETTKGYIRAFDGRKRKPRFVRAN